MSRLEEITQRLEAITAELADPELDDERAGELTREAAQLAAEAGEEANRLTQQAQEGD
jgi:hypothetical protein